jgi:hypothetical protein
VSEDYQAAAVSGAGPSRNNCELLARIDHTRRRKFLNDWNVGGPIANFLY